jgi:UDP-glucose 4-epimerase
VVIEIILINLNRLFMVNKLIYFKIKYINKMQVLLTGGLGYIGSILAVELIQNNYKVIIVDNLSNSDIGVLDNIEKITTVKPLFYQCDVTNKKKLHMIFNDNKIDAVIHLAGYKSVSESVLNPLKYYENNVGGLLSLLKCMKNFNVKKLIFSSSASVYGNPESLPLTEESKVNVLNPYGQSKLTSEIILKDCVSDNLSIISLRYFNPVGAHSSGLIGDTSSFNLFPVIMSVYKGYKDKLEIYGNDYDTKDNYAVRDYIHVVDLAKGHLKALENLNENEPKYDVFNLGTGKGYSVMEIVKAFEHHSGKTLPYVLKSRREGEAAEVYAKCIKSKEILSWETIYNIDDMIKDTLKFQGV